VGDTHPADRRNTLFLSVCVSLLCAPAACFQPDEAGAILNYYFGAANGDLFASAALGYRHAYGLGVPKSCWSAVAYYK
jgi:TPR repeat protein